MKMKNLMYGAVVFLCIVVSCCGISVAHSYHVSSQKNVRYEFSTYKGTVVYETSIDSEKEIAETLYRMACKEEQSIYDADKYFFEKYGW